MAEKDFDKAVLNDMYASLKVKARKVLASMHEEQDFSFDSFLDDSSSRIRIASLEDLFAFDRIDKTNRLVHKVTQDLWTIGTDESGHPYIAKCFEGTVLG